MALNDKLNRLLGDAKILLVDDEPVNLVLLTHILNRAGYHRVESVNDPREAVTAFERFQPDLVCTDLNMPFMSGFDLLSLLMACVGDSDYLPILMITANTLPDTEEKALALGAKDFLTKPFKGNQIKLRVANLLRTRFLHLELRKHTEDLERTVRERTQDLKTAHLEVVERLALASEYRDYTTGQHTSRVGTLSARIAQRLGYDEAEAELLYKAASLHDVGKIGIPDDVLLNPGKLSKREWDVMKTHVKIGGKLLAHGRSALIRLAETVALTHHERWDGSGYPHGLKGDEVPLAGQIVAVADVFDTLTHQRPYKNAWSVAEAVAEIRGQRDQHFSPRVVDAFGTGQPGRLGSRAVWGHRAQRRNAARYLKPRRALGCQTLLEPHAVAQAEQVVTLDDDGQAQQYQHRRD
ncbi:two-component system response regulator [soil metagenome]